MASGSFSVIVAIIAAFVARHRIERTVGETNTRISDLADRLEDTLIPEIQGHYAWLHEKLGVVHRS